MKSISSEKFELFKNRYFMQPNELLFYLVFTWLMAYMKLKETLQLLKNNGNKHDAESLEVKI